MDGYVSEQEQVEQIKKWWAENGRTVMISAILGFGVFFGGRAWLDHKAGLAEQASLTYAEVLQAVEQRQPENVEQKVQALLAEGSSGEYAVMGSLLLAQQKMDQGDTAGAKAHLQWVLNNTTQDGLKTLARLRLARLLTAEGALDEALTQLGAGDNGTYAALFAELRGDILLAKHDRQGAHEAYGQALETASGANKRWLQMKYDDLNESATTAKPAAPAAAEG